MSELDLSGVRIYSNTKDDARDALNLMNEEVYMSDNENFKQYCTCKLTGVQFTEDSSLPFLGYDGNKRKYYKYFILCKDAKFKEEEKTYKIFRPYKNISEFCNETGCEEIGMDAIIIRNKKEKREAVLLYTGYSEDAVHLGGYVLTFETLVKHYEFYNRCGKDGEWKPFGIEE